MKSALVVVLAGFVSAGPALGAQAVAAQAQPAPAQQPPGVDKYVIPFGTRIPLVLVNSVSTRTSQVGDRVYLQTSFPVFTSTAFKFVLRNAATSACPGGIAPPNPLLP